MANAKKFINRVEYLVSKKVKKNELNHFGVVAEKSNANILNKQLYGLYKASIGRTYAPKIVQMIVDILTALYIAQIANTESIFLDLQSELESLLNEDRKLSPIQKFFKEYKNDYNYILEIYKSENNFAAPYLAIITLAGKEDADLRDVLIQFAGILQTKNITKKAFECLEYAQNEEFGKCELIGLKYLRSLVNHYAIVSTMTPLLEVSPNIKSREIKELISKCRIYGVSNKLEEVLDSEASSLAEALEEIEDIFLDFPQGKVRKEGLAMFRKYSV